jgi:acyl-CoA synthetase (AMP-forming)/AMP-acid ligase II
MNFALFVEMHARGRPDALAVADQRVRLTYRELNDAANRFAGMLSKAGFCAADRVAFFLPNRVELAIGLIGAFKAGLIAVPVNWRLKAADLKSVLAHAQPVLLVTSANLVGELPENPPFHVLIANDKERSGSFWKALDEAATLQGSVGRQNGDVANILYTSGTTSTPKAVIHTHGMRAAIAATMADCFQLSCNDVGIAVSPMFHTGGLSVFSNAMFCGGSVHLMEKWDLEDFINTIEREKVTFMHLVSTVVVDIVRAPESLFANRDIHVRFTWGGGHSVDPSIFLEFERRVGGVFLQGYSRTEGGITYNPLDRATRRFDMHGFPNGNNSELAIIDPATGLRCPRGVVGEIAFRGDGVSPGYWDRNNIIVPPPYSGGFQPTGDRGYIREDGALVFLGREDHMIKSGGENVYPAEVLAVLLALEGVSDAVVFDTPDDRLGQVVSALVVLKDRALTTAQIEAACRSRLAGFKLPRRMALVDSLPRLGSQKIDLNACRAILHDKLGPTS